MQINSIKLTQIVAILLICMLNCTAQDLEEQIVSTWRESRHKYDQCKGSYEMSVKVGKTSTNGTYIVNWLDKLHGSLQLVDERKVVCINPLYSFELSKPARNDDNWMLVDFSDLNNFAEEGRVKKKKNAIYGVQSFLVPRIGLATIWDVLDAENLQITNVVENGDGTTTARVSHSISNARPPFEEQSIEQTGVVHLANDLQFSPLSFEMNFKLSSKVRILEGSCSGKMEYSEDVFPTKIQILEVYRGATPLSIDRNLTCKLTSHSPLKSDFFLSAYGLPEPNAKQSNKLTWGVFAAILIATAFFSWRRMGARK